MAEYIFLTCQAGMEPLVKAEYLSQVPTARLAFSRRGIVTFKLPDAPSSQSETAPRGILSRTYGTSLDHVQVKHPPAELVSVENEPSLRTSIEPAPRIGAREFSELLQDPNRFGDSSVSRELIQLTVAAAEQTSLGPWDGVHVWVRDGLLPATNWSRVPNVELPDGWQRFITRLTEALQAKSLIPTNVRCNQNAEYGQRILNLCLVEPNQLIVGQHLVQHSFQRWSGGVIPSVPTAVPPISRAYFKIREAVSWAGLDMRPGQTCVEIGSAPGGSCQWLLEQDLKVIGIDPAEIDPLVANHPKFKHVRRRGREVKRHELKNCDWLLSDANLPPNYVLDTIEDLVRHPLIKPQGLVLTLKLPDTKLLEHWNSWTKRVASWGFTKTLGRQLVFNRQEVCLVATKQRRG